MNINSCKEAIAYIRKFALVEEEYGRSISRHAATMSDKAEHGQLKAGSFARAWRSVLQCTDGVGQRHTEACAMMNHLADALQDLYKNTERSRKQASEHRSVCLSMSLERECVCLGQRLGHAPQKASRGCRKCAWQGKSIVQGARMIHSHDMLFTRPKASWSLSKTK